jgi:hypothetical protein
MHERYAEGPTVSCDDGFARNRSPTDDRQSCDDLAMVNIDVVWDRITRYAGDEFHTITGLPFTYQVPGNYLRVSRTVRGLSRSNFAKALDLMPARGPVRSGNWPDFLSMMHQHHRISSALRVYAALTVWGWIA